MGEPVWFADPKMPTRHTVSCELSWKRCTTRRSPRPPVSNTEDLSHLTVSTNSCPCPKLTDAWSEELPSMPRSSDASSTSNKNNNDDDDTNVASSCRFRATI